MKFENAEVATGDICCTQKFAFKLADGSEIIVCGLIFVLKPVLDCNGLCLHYIYLSFQQGIT